MKRVVPCVLALVLTISGAASAADGTDPRAQRPLTLAEVTSAVEARFPLLAAAERDRAIAAADVLSAEGGFDPAVRARGQTIPFGPYPNDRVEVYVEQPTALWGTRFVGGYRYGRGSFAVYDGKAETGDLGEARIGAITPLWRDGPIDRRRAAMARAELGTTVAKLSVEEQKLAFIRAASLRYWDWVAAGRRVAIARDLLEMATLRDAQLVSRVQHGELPAYERTENLRAMHQREAQVVQAERSLQNAAIELSLYLRGTDGSPIVPGLERLPPSLPEPAPLAGSVDRMEGEALARRPEPARIAAQREQSRIDRQLADNQRKPGIDFSIAGIKDFGRAPDPKMTKPELEVGVLLDIPILTRVQDGRVRAAEAQLSKLEAQAQFAKDRVVADVRDASSATTMARDRALAVKREVDVSRQLVLGERQRFDLGESSLLIVNLREQAYGEAELREVDALADYQRSVASLRAATGGGPAR